MRTPYNVPVPEASGTVLIMATYYGGNGGRIRGKSPKWRVAELHGAMAAQPGGGWARNLAERLMSADQTRGRRAGVENVWRSRDAYPRHHLRLKQRLNATCGH